MPIPNTIPGWTMGPLFILGHSHWDGVQNYYYLTGQGTPPIPPINQYSNGQCVGQYLGQMLRLPATTIGAWTPSGTKGTNYASGGAQINSSLTNPNSSLIAQIAKLIADYGGTLPANSVVLCGIGDDDILNALASGGQWTASATQTWTTTGVQSMVNATSTQVLNVVSSTGAIVGTSNFIMVPLAGGLAGPFAITATGAGTISFVQNNALYNGSNIPAAGTVVTYAMAAVQGAVNALPTPIANLVSAGCSSILFTNPFNFSYYPYSVGQITLAQTTWQMYLNQIAATVANSQKNVRLLDHQPFWSDLISNPTKYGFKDATTSWNGSGSLNPSDLVWFDNLHPTAAAHRNWAQNIFSKLINWGLVQSVY